MSPNTRSRIAPRRRAAAPLALSDVDALVELRKHLTLETAHFSHPWESPDDPLPKTEREVNEFIERRTRVWRESWILPILDEMIARERRQVKPR